MRLAYPTPPRGSHKGVPLRVVVWRTARVSHRFGRITPPILTRCGAGYAKRTTIINIPPRRRIRPSFRAQYPVIPNAEPCDSERTPCHSERSEESRRVAEVWRLGASGVPHPAPGQPQGRAPTRCAPPLPFGHFPRAAGETVVPAAFAEIRRMALSGESFGLDQGG